MISNKKRFIFVHIPKTGGNSITTALDQYSDDKLMYVRPNSDGMYDGISVFNKKFNKIRKHSKLNEIEQYYDLNKYFKFSVVRNPWDKILSWYFYHEKFNNIKNFDEFLDLIFIKKEVPKVSKDDISWYESQISFLKDKSGKINIDYIIKFENFSNDFEILCDKLKINKIELPHTNKSKNSEIDYREFYNEKQKDFVGEIYIEDIEYFKYKFD
ncbi:MAG: sulfotransferase family 2 domain-containing protein [archaeon]